MRFRQTEFPGNARVLDACDRRSARSTAVAGNENDIRMRFRHAGCDGADADFRNQFDGDARARIRVLQVIDQLREIFDRINIVVRRR